ncbi:MAG: peptide chain release factor N(5)-glutamine methyltransferase [bacterium]|nr:peptide chain release factor N(5)-glutamine methyltransferase [bacterium]
MSYQDLSEEGKKALSEAGIEEASVDSWYLLEYVTKMSRSQFFLKREQKAALEEQQQYFELIQKRAQHIPLQYIIGEQEFMGLPFTVNKNVLIPRQDTEVLTELALAYVKGKKVLDMCTGSGCIAVSLMHYGQPEECHAADISAEALEVARGNAERNQAEIKWIESNLFENITEQYDVIVSNPPYIRPDVIETLMPEVREFEPMKALDGGSDGLLFYRQITEGAVKHLNKGGYLLYEIGYDQAAEVTEIMKKNGFCHISCQKDYAGNDRVVFGQYK